MLAGSDIRDQSSKVVGVFIEIDPRTGDFDKIYIQASSENEEQVVKKAVARIMRPPEKEIWKKLLRRLRADIFNFFRSVKLIQKTRILRKEFNNER